MKLSKEGFKLLIKLEGLKLSPYLDSAGIPTIGIGNTFYEDGKKVTMKDKPITLLRAVRLAKKVLEKFEKSVNTEVNVTISQNRFDSLVCFCYNVGIHAFSRSSVLRLLNENKIKEAANSFLLWNKAGGKESKGLTNRRKIERELFLKE